MGKLRELVDSLTAGGVVHSNSGNAIHVSSNGTTTASSGALSKVVRESFRAMRDSSPQTNNRGNDKK